MFKKLNIFKKSLTTAHTTNFNYSYMFEGANAKWSGRNYNSFAREAYCKNVIANRAINIIAQSARSVPWKLFENPNSKKLSVNNHRLLKLLDAPNLKTAGAEFFEAIYCYKMISGNAFILAICDEDDIPIELHLLRPDRVNVVPGKNGMAAGYFYKVDNNEKFYPVNQITGRSKILHLKQFNPLDDWQGLSSIESAAYSIDQHNQAAQWNQSLLQNGARPSGALVVNSERGHLSNEQFSRLKEEIEDKFSGANNAGKPMLLEGGLDWREMSMSPKDMDFIEAKNSAARDIALAFGVPPQLLGIPGDNTYSNMQEARLALWEETILPLLDRTADALNHWLVPMFGKNLKLSYDIEEISGLSLRREAIWQRIDMAKFLTINEKRKMIGLEDIAEGDKL